MYERAIWFNSFTLLFVKGTLDKRAEFSIVIVMLLDRNNQIRWDSKICFGGIVLWPIRRSFFTIDQFCSEKKMSIQFTPSNMSWIFVRDCSCPDGLVCIRPLGYKYPVECVHPSIGTNISHHLAQGQFNNITLAICILLAVVILLQVKFFLTFFIFYDPSTFLQ